jgi:CHAT domain-containing protein/Tfp pilus assembly protein PilF
LALVVLILVQQTAQSDTPDVLEPLKSAEQVYRQQGPEAALPIFVQLRDSYRTTGDSGSESTAIRFIGEIYWRFGEFEKADTNLQLALVMKRENGDRFQEGKILNVLGLLNWDLGNYTAAKEYFSQGSVIAQDFGDKKLAGAILNNLSLVNDEQGDYLLSLEQYKQVLELYKGIDFPRGESDTLGNIGGVYLLLGKYAEALSYYQRALAISEQRQSIPSMSQDHGNIAMSQLDLGQTALALEHFDKAIELADQAGMRQDVAYWQRGKASALIRNGKYDLALENYRLALAAYSDIDAPAESLETMHDMGRLHLLLGDSTSAETYFTDAMKKAQSIGLARGITINLLALGDLQARQQAWEKAEMFYQQVSERSRESGEMMWLIESLLRLGGVQQQRGLYGLAAGEVQQALSIARNIEARPAIAAALFNLAELERLDGNTDAAMAAFTKAKEASVDLLDPELLWRIHYGTALVLDELGDHQSAIKELLAAVTVIEGVRDRLEEQRFRAGYIQDKYQVYVQLVRLQIETGKAVEAFSTAERLRSRSFIELLENDTGRNGVDEETSAVLALQERIRQLRLAMNEEQALERPEQRQVAMDVYSSELLAAEREYETLLENRQSGRKPIAGSARSLAKTPGYAEVREQLAGDEALIEYVVGQDNLMVFILTRESLLTEAIPMGQQELDSRIELLRDLIRRPENDRWVKPAQKLADALIGPIEQRGLLANITHLYLVPHGSLNYLPFSLLPSGQQGRQLVIEKFTLAYLPTAAALVRSSRPGSGLESLLAVAPSSSQLEFAPAEAESVNDMFKPDSNLLLGKQATETAFKKQAGEYSILHLATHGYFNKLNPLLSGLELESDASNDGQLELYEILELQLDAELVTLSACQTALGSGHFSETPAGDDFVGLTRAFIYAGSQSVMASLWKVDDRSTMDLMQDFYERLKQNHSSKSDALAGAQRDMRSSLDYRHPYYWAPFILVGNRTGNRG